MILCYFDCQIEYNPFLRYLTYYFRTTVEGKNEDIQTKDSIIHDLKARIDVLSNQLTEAKKENDELKEQEKGGENDLQKNIEIQNLIHDNTILNEE